MPWPFAHGRQVTVTPNDVDPRTQERTASEPAVLTSCAFEPGEGREVEGRDGTTVVATAIVYGPYDADVSPNATVTVEGVVGVWEVDGDVRRWRSDLTGTEACSEIHLLKKAGAV